MKDWSRSTLGQRVEHAIKKSGLAHNEFARKAGIETASLTRLKQDESIGETHHREAVMLARVAEASAVDQDWLARAKGQPDRPSVAPAPAELEMFERYPSKRQAAIMLRGEVSQNAIEAMLTEEHYGSDKDPGGSFWISRGLFWHADIEKQKSRSEPEEVAAEFVAPPPMLPRPKKPKGKK